MDILVLSWVGWILLHERFHQVLVRIPVAEEQTEAREAVEEEGDLAAKGRDGEATDKGAETSAQTEMQAFEITNRQKKSFII